MGSTRLMLCTILRAMPTFRCAVKDHSGQLFGRNGNACHETQAGFEPALHALQACASPLGHRVMVIRFCHVLLSSRIPNPTRTGNLRFRKPMLYPLSYGDMGDRLSCRR